MIEKSLRRLYNAKKSYKPCRRTASKNGTGKNLFCFAEKTAVPERLAAKACTMSLVNIRKKTLRYATCAPSADAFCSCFKKKSALSKHPSESPKKSESKKNAESESFLAGSKKSAAAFTLSSVKPMTMRVCKSDKCQFVISGNGIASCMMPIGARAAPPKTKASSAAIGGTFPKRTIAKKRTAAGKKHSASKG